MINKSGFISQKFIKYFFDNEILNEGVAILIDCSRYINKNKSGFISQKFIKYFFDDEIPVPFLNEGVAILIDCSRYINKNKKLFNMFLICGLTEGLN